MTRDLTPQLRRDIAMNFDHTDAALVAVATPVEDERRLIVRIVLAIAAVCLFAVLSAS